MLIAGVLVGAVFTRARPRKFSLLVGSGMGATAWGGSSFGTVAASVTIRLLGTVLPEGDAKASDIAVRLHGWAAVDGWLLIACALAPLGEELLWRRCMFTALAGAAATRLGECRAILLAAMLSG